MDSSMRFAPISSARSTRLELVVAYFALNGATVFVVLLLGLVQAAFGRNAEFRELLSADPFGFILATGMGGLLLVVAWQLHHRSRRAAVVAAILLGLPIAGWLYGAQASVVALVAGVIGLALIASVWDELRPAADAVGRPKRAL